MLLKEDTMNKVIGAGITSLGVISGIAGVLATPPGIRSWALFTLVISISIVAIIFLMTIYRERNRKNIGINPEIIDIAFMVQEADEDDIRWIAELQKSIYSKQDAVPLNVLLEWYRVFPNGFFVIKDNSGKAVGHLDILPIKKDTLKLYKEGIITETEIRGECLFSPEETDKIIDIYIESLIVSIPDKNIRGFALREVIRSIPYIISHVGNPSKIKRISAMAATKDGESILTHMGFQLISNSEKRKDGHKMFEAKFEDFYKGVMAIYHVNSKALGRMDIDQGL